MEYLLFKGLLFFYMFAIAVYSVVVVAGRLDQPRPVSGPFDVVAIAVIGLLGLVALGFGVFLWILFFTHVFLILTNQTTAEYLKDARQDHPANPFRESPNQLPGPQRQEVLHLPQQEEPPRLLDPLRRARGGREDLPRSAGAARRVLDRISFKAVRLNSPILNFKSYNRASNKQR